MKTRPENTVPCGFVSMGDISAAIALTLPANKAPRYAFVQCFGKDVNWRDDGVDPTAAADGGMVLTVGASMWCDQVDLTKIKFIQTAASARLNVTFYA